MSVPRLYVHGRGLVTSIGLDANSTCAAIRAKVSNPIRTSFVDTDGDWITGHEVPVASSRRGVERFARMAAMAIDEALRDQPLARDSKLPLLLCVAEAGRPGRPQGLDQHLRDLIEKEINLSFSADSSLIAAGRAGVGIALREAQALLARTGITHVLIAAVDSLLDWETLLHYNSADRLLTPTHSNGFTPGEAAGSVLLAPQGGEGRLGVHGVGIGIEAAILGSGEPLRADGLTQAIRGALAEAGWEMHDIDFRVADLSGEQYYFKEAALAVQRTLRRRKPEFETWHPAECTGEAGAAAGISVLCVCEHACRNRYAPGNTVLAHLSSDGGVRAAIALQYGEA